MSNKEKNKHIQLRVTEEQHRMGYMEHRNEIVR